VKRHFGHSPSRQRECVRHIECPKCRFGGGAFCWSRPVPHLAALRGGDAQLAMNRVNGIREFRNGFENDVRDYALLARSA